MAQVPDASMQKPLELSDGLNENMIVATIQARMNSKRLPGKVLLKIGELMVIEHILHRLNKVKSIDLVQVVTTENDCDDQLCKVVSRLPGVKVFRGDEKDVLKRIHDSVKHLSPELIVHAFGDNIFIDPDTIEDSVKQFLTGGYEFGFYSNCPTGFGVDLYSMEALRESHRKACASKDREHANSYILNKYEHFKMLKYIPERKKYRKTNIRLTLDTESDLDEIMRLNEIFDQRLHETPTYQIMDEINELKNNIDYNQKYTSELVFKLKNNLT